MIQENTRPCTGLTQVLQSGKASRSSSLIRQAGDDHVPVIIGIASPLVYRIFWEVISGKLSVPQSCFLPKLAFPRTRLFPKC
jgi:hypothetical protein